MVTTSNMKIRSQEADCQVAFQFDQPHHPDILCCKPTGGFSCWPCRPSCDDQPTASAIPEASRMLFCHESLQGLEDRVFLQCQERTLETFIYGGCLGNQNNFHTSQDCVKSHWHVSGPRSEGNDRAVWEGKGWGSRWSSGHHTPFTPTWCLSSLLCPRRSGWIVLWNHTLSMSFRGQLGRRLSAGLSIMITGAYSHALPFQDGNTESATLGSLSVVLLCTQPRLGKLTSFLLVIPAPGRLCMHISRKV